MFVLVNLTGLAYLLVPVTWITAEAVPLVVAGQRGRLIEVTAGLAGVLLGTWVAALLTFVSLSPFPTNLVDAIPHALLYSGLPFLLTAVPTWLVARRQAARGRL